MAKLCLSINNNFKLLLWFKRVSIELKQLTKTVRERMGGNISHIFQTHECNFS